MKINWEEIKTSCGNAKHIPSSIEKLNSKDEEERKSAYWEIDNFVILQSDLYEASYYIIEPLVELLELNYSVDRTYPLRLLAEIALGGNGTKKININGNNSKTIYEACRNKLQELKDRIIKIEAHTNSEIIEKLEILENI